MLVSKLHIYVDVMPGFYVILLWGKLYFHWQTFFISFYWLKSNLNMMLRIDIHVYFIYCTCFRMIIHVSPSVPQLCLYGACICDLWLDTYHIYVLFSLTCTKHLQFSVNLYFFDQKNTVSVIFFREVGRVKSSTCLVLMLGSFFFIEFRYCKWEFSAVI